jgi:hypothetical protein
MHSVTLTGLCLTTWEHPWAVQQKLMRHSDIRTTMNVYGSAYEQSKRQANERVAGKLLGQQEAPAPQEMVQ